MICICALIAAFLTGRRICKIVAAAERLLHGWLVLPNAGACHATSSSSYCNILLLLLLLIAIFFFFFFLLQGSVGVLFKLRAAAKWSVQIYDNLKCSNIY